MAAHIDNRVFDVLRAWTGLSFLPNTVETILSATPSRLGGAGVPTISPILDAAFADSRDRALRAVRYHPVDGPSPVTQSVASDAIHDANVIRLSADPSVRFHLKETSKKHASRWLSAHSFHFPKALYAAWFRRRVLGRHPAEPDRLKCGCGRVLPNKDFSAHVVGCASRPGNNSNKKHNAVVDLLAEFCKRAGVVHEPEPRGFQRYKCYICNKTVERADLKSHKKVCRADLIRSGPDLRAVVCEDEVFYDYTTLHITSPCHLQDLVNGVSEKKILEKVISKKCDTYRLNFPAESFVVITAFEHGGMDKPLVDLIRSLADRAKVEASKWLDEFAVLLAMYNADALQTAYRQSSFSFSLNSFNNNSSPSFPPSNTPALPRSDGHHPTRTPISPLECQNPPNKKSKEESAC